MYCRKGTASRRLASLGRNAVPPQHLHSIGMQPVAEGGEHAGSPLHHPRVAGAPLVGRCPTLGYVRPSAFFTSDIILLTSYIILHPS